MNNKQFGIQLEKRTLNFGVKIIKPSRLFPENAEGKVLKYQIIKSGTSIGANYREANRSRSKPDFINRIKICESEANETLYWLEIIENLEWSFEKDSKSVFEELKELLAIFTSINHKLKKP